MKIAVLWTYLSGYLNACLRELTYITNVELFVAHQFFYKDSPFDKKQFSWIANRYEYQIHADKRLLLSKLKEFRPDILLVTSWHMSEYRFILKKFSGKAFRVLAMDNPWRGTLKQWLGVISFKSYLHRLYDAVFLPGERQALFAERLGFKEPCVLRGLYCCDHSSFAAVYKKRSQNYLIMPKAFIYAGRFSEEKGIDILINAYLQYRSSINKPLSLICCGTEELTPTLEGISGIEVHGFIQPNDLPQEFAQASCLLLPSIFEPWGVVIHEATASGLSVICSSACGASVNLVQDGYNGYIIESGNVNDLANAMLRYSKLSDEQIKNMSRNSYNLSLQFTPDRWAAYFYERIKELMKERFGTNDKP